MRNQEHQDYPYITLSFGMSLDGKIATVTGDSKYISSLESRAFVHQLRSQHDAILVGINTVLIDHPQLTTRLEGVQGKNPIKVILDSSLKISLDEPLLVNTSPHDVIIVTSRQADPNKKQTLEAMGVRIIELNQDRSPLDLNQAMKLLKQWGIQSVLVEGGSTVHFSFIERRLFNRLFVSISPIIIGGETAKTAVGGNGFETLSQAVKLSIVRQFQLGVDLMIEAINASKEDTHD
jgi:diaminohydroxyphosphoribosylaminopyrimidine deaminase/5-amino-6-(5-phosphoribosylamino)uracil reductase